jgi:hypothetical protein
VSVRQRSIAPVVLLFGALVGLAGALGNADWLLVTVFAIVAIVAVFWFRRGQTDG